MQKGGPGHVMCCSVHDFVYNRTWLFVEEKRKQLFPLVKIAMKISDT